MTPETDSELATLVTGPPRKIYEISLLLASQNIVHEIRTHENVPLEKKSGNRDLEIRVTREMLAAAREQMALYFRENRNWGAFLPTGFKTAPTPFLFLVIPTLFFLAQNSLRLNGARLTEAGVNASEKVLAGEWWRVFTALSLHVDAKHFLANFLSGYFVLSFLSTYVSWAKAFLWVFLLSGLANALNGLMLHPHRSIGFSTAVFCALGLLSGVQWKHQRQWKLSLQKSWIPLAGGVFLLAMMGLSEGTDVTAHILGFFCGVLGALLPLNYLTSRDSPGRSAMYYILLWLFNAVVWGLALGRGLR